MENSSNKKDESTYVFDKSMNCPVCDADFKTKQVKTGKARFLGTEADLRSEEHTSELSHPLSSRMPSSA